MTMLRMPGHPDEWEEAEGAGAFRRRPPGAGLLRSTVIVVGTFVALAFALGFASRLVQPRLLGAAAPAGSSPGSAVALAARPVPNRLVYRADANGHFIIDASVNGAPIRFLLDTGASMVTLSPEDARAAGIAPGDLRFSQTMSTANGPARAAALRLRSLRLGQYEVTEVPAVVMERAIPVSLLGMSFLDRLSGYSIRDGVLTIDW